MSVGVKFSVVPIWVLDWCPPRGGLWAAPAEGVVQFQGDAHGARQQATN
jgi:hypothetical protein